MAARRTACDPCRVPSRARVCIGLSLFTGRDAVRGALRMVLIGGGAGAVSFLVRRLLGVVIG